MSRRERFSSESSSSLNGDIRTKQSLRNKESSSSSFTTNLHEIWVAIPLALKYLVSDLSRNKRNVLLGIFTVFLAVAFVCTFQNTVEKSPLIFLRMAEKRIGEYDLLLWPSGKGSVTFLPSSHGDGTNILPPTGPDVDITPTNPLLNETEISQRLSSLDIVKGTAPRWTLLGKAINPSKPTRNVSVVVLIIDSDKEKNMGLGRSWGRRRMGQGEAYVSSSALRALDVAPNQGERISVGVDVKKLLSGLGLGNPDLPQDQFLAQILKPSIKKTLLYSLANSPPIGVNSSEFLETLGYPVPEPLRVFTPNETNFNASDLPDDTIDNMVDSLYDLLVQGSLNQGSFYSEFTVLDSVEDPVGKWPDVLGSVVVIEAKYVPFIIKTLLPNNRLLVDALFQSLNLPDINSQNLDQTLLNMNINEYALVVAVGFEKRLDVYLQNSQPRQRKLVEYTNKISLALGLGYPVRLELPISNSLDGLGYIRMFLDQVFGSTVVILIGLSGLLIYSLLLSDVEDKTFEFGMLRSLGLQKQTLLFLLVLQSLVYGIPGTILGLGTGLLLNSLLQQVISTYTAIPPDYHPTTYSVTVALCLGLFLPLLSNILPIKRALSRTLREALDLYHQTVNEIKVKVERLEDLGLSGWIISVSVFLVGAGFLVFYLLPYCIIFLNIPLFLTILNFILIGMVLGAGTVASLIEGQGELLVLWVLLRWSPDFRLSVLVKKNLSGHRPRNRKTAIMLTISMTFIVFSGSMLTLQSGALKDDVRYGLGSSIVFFTPTRWKPLDRGCVTDLLNHYPLLPFPSDKTYLNNHPELNNSFAFNRNTNSPLPRMRYSFVTYDMAMEVNINEILISNVGGSLPKRVRLQGVDMDLAKSTYTKYYLPSELAGDLSFDRVEDNYDLISSLYYNTNNDFRLNKTNGALSHINDVYPNGDDEIHGCEVLISEALREGAQLDTSRPLLLTVKTWYGNNIKILCKAHALLRKVPGFYYSSYKETANRSPVLISMKTYMDIMNRINSLYRQTQSSDYEFPRYSSVTQPAVLKVMIRMEASANRSEREDVVNSLLNCAEDDTVVAVNTEEILTSLQSSTDLLILFFHFVSLVASVVCFFGLWLSFAANIRENSWELGVLRALGLTARQVVRVYIYEALCIVFTSGFLGSVIGMLLAVTLTLQSDLFTEMPFDFAIPWGLLGLTIGAGSLIAILGSYIPASGLLDQQIAHALKGT